MEYIEGETLADRLKKGSLPLDQALRCGIEITDALDKAHRQGVVHRDLKPGNVMLTKAGAKLLDFGLAKLKASGPGQEGSVLSALPTEEKPLTEKGAILGTFQYMAPEQLEGKDADARTDIFAFGAVLYEMVTGMKAFEGKSQASLITAIMSSEPRPMSELQPLAPSLLERTVRKCLAKEPEDRWQSAKDLDDEMKWIAESGSKTGAPEPAISAPTSVWKRALTVGLIFLMGAVVTGITVWSLMRAPSSESLPLKRFAITIPQTDRFHGWSGIALSADGKNLVYSAQREGVSRLFLRAIEQLHAIRISGTEGASKPFFSPDGKWVGFFADGKLKKVSLVGGPTVTICDAEGSRGASWESDDTITFASTDNPGLMQVQAAAGEPQPVTIPDTDQGELSHWWPDTLPGGKAVIFTVWYGSLETARIAVQSLETGQRKMLVDGTSPRYALTGHIIFAREDSLWAVPFDVDRIEATGSPTPLLESTYVGERGYTNFAFAGEETLIYQPMNIVGDRTLVWANRKGLAEPLSAPPRAYERPRLSPDGEMLAILDVEGGKTRTSGDIWIYDIRRDTSTRLTFTGDNENPVWTPDGKRIAFTSGRGGTWNVFWKPADGSGGAEQLTTGVLDQWVTSMSPDGKLLAFHEHHPTTEADI
jgi:serine/threonine-protein kinase